MRPYNDGASVFASRCAIIILAKGGGAVSDDIKSDNPFDLAHYAGMQAWKQRGSDTRKLDYMKLLLAELDRRGWSHEAKMALLWFIEGVMHIEDDSAWNDGG